MAKMIRHMQSSIEGMLRNMKGKHGHRESYLDGEDGQPMTFNEARAALREYKKKGWKVIPCGDCEGFDYFGGGCPGHPVEEPHENVK